MGGEAPPVKVISSLGNKQKPQSVGLQRQFGVENGVGAKPPQLEVIKFVCSSLIIPSPNQKL